MKYKILNGPGLRKTFDHSAAVDLPVASVKDHDDYFVIHTGVAIEMDPWLCGLLMVRSSVSDRIRMLNGVGLIDPGYRGELKARISYYGSPEADDLLGEYVLQLLVLPFRAPNFTLVEELSETERGEGGFGSTGNGK